MKFSILLAPLLVALIVPSAKAQQNIGPLKLDPSFANNGKSEIDFEGANDDATCFVWNSGLNRILVAGKVYASTPGEIRFGVVEYDASGMLESGFGTNGKTDILWNDGFDYPNAISLLPNGNVLAAGASDHGPAFFRLKANGTPDSSFGNSGISYSPISQAITISGAFENVDTLSVGIGNTSTHYLAEGPATISTSGGDKFGFYAARIDSSGKADLDFGSSGSAFLQAPVAIAQGHLVEGDTILFTGLSNIGTYPEIILGKLLPNGTPDSSFGTNGVLHSGITLHGGNWLQSVYDQSTFDPYPGLLVAAPLSDSAAMLPFTVIKFKLDGTLDSNYGKNGIATAPVISSMKVYGLTPPNNKGYTHLSGGIGDVSATAQFLPTGAIDSTFGTKGIALLDADNGLRKNFLVGFVSASMKRFVGIGTSVNAVGNDDFLVARYIQGIAVVSAPRIGSEKSLQVYPNPAHEFVTVQAVGGAIEQITVADALGRIIKSFEHPGFAASSDSYALDVSDIPSGAYNCTVRTTEGISSQRFSVMH